MYDPKLQNPPRSTKCPPDCSVAQVAHTCPYPTITVAATTPMAVYVAILALIRSYLSNLRPRRQNIPFGARSPTHSRDRPKATGRSILREHRLTKAAPPQIGAGQHVCACYQHLRVPPDASRWSNFKFDVFSPKWSGASL